MPRFLIVNADDLGLSAGVNRGILEVHERGIVTSTTVMVNLPDAADGINLLLREAPQIGVGLHFNITHGRPISPAEQVRSLVNADGAFYKVQAFYGGVKDGIDAGEVRREMQAQFSRFIDLAGHPPDHLDAHHGATYNIPAAFDEMLKLAAHYDLPMRSGQSSLDNPALRAVYDSNPRPRWPDYTEGRFYGDTATVDTLLSILPNLPDGVSELVCHPGYAHDVDEAYKATREDELRALTDRRVRDLLRQEDILLVTFGYLKHYSNSKG